MIDNSTSWESCCSKLKRSEFAFDEVVCESVDDSVDSVRSASPTRCKITGCSQQWLGNFVGSGLFVVSSEMVEDEFYDASVGVRRERAWCEQVRIVVV